MRTSLTSFNPPTPAKAAAAAAATQQPSPWHSPVPYLFGGLAAMLGLISFALLILACSYWKLSGSSDDNNNNNNNHNAGDENGDRDVVRGQTGEEGDGAKAVKVYEEKILVIMPGDEKPTFLATPISCSRNASYSFADSSKEMNENEETVKIENGEKVKEDHQDTQRHQEQNQ